MTTVTDFKDLHSRRKLIDDERASIELLRFEQFCQIWMFPLLDGLASGPAQGQPGAFLFPIAYDSRTGQKLGWIRFDGRLAILDFSGIGDVSLPFSAGQAQPVDASELGRLFALLDA